MLFNYSLKCTAVAGALFVSTLCSSASTPVFLVTPRAKATSPLMSGQTGTAIYEITNNSNRDLANIGVTNLPAGVSLVQGLDYDYCVFPVTLAAGDHCLIKLAINSSVSGDVHGGPKVCYSATNPVYCSQPFAVDQLSVNISRASGTCDDNVANFNNAMAMPFDIPPVKGTGWGPAHNHFPLSTSNPDLAACATDTPDGNRWQQRRIIAAADYWIKQKLNYCEHHTPDFQTPVSQRHNIYGAPNGGYCNAVVDLDPSSVYYNQQARWNYSGTGAETIRNWGTADSTEGAGAMWFGFDCSNYTSWLYDFALGIQIDAVVSAQAGQTEQSKIQESPLLGPNNGGAGGPYGAGYLVCKDGTADTATTTCAGAGNPYISTIDSSGDYHPDDVTVEELTAALQPGDLIYVAGDLDANTHVPKVTHVIMWVGKTIGTGADQIKPRQIAPNELCYHHDQWVPVNGQPVITDSHYQGADYRMLTKCFYMDNIWAVRRIIPTP